MMNLSRRPLSTSPLLRVPARLPDAWLVRRDVRRGVP